MKNLATTIAVGLALALVAGGAVAVQPGDLNKNTLEDTTPTLALQQEGENSGCLDYLALWAADTVHSPIGDTERVEVTAGDAYTAGSGDGIVWVDFYTEGGIWIDGNGDESGTAPTNTAYGYACVTVGGSWPDVPVPAATFTFEVL